MSVDPKVVEEWPHLIERGANATRGLIGGASIRHKELSVHHLAREVGMALMWRGIGIVEPLPSPVNSVVAAAEEIIAGFSTDKNEVVLSYINGCVGHLVYKGFLLSVSKHLIEGE